MDYCSYCARIYKIYQSAVYCVIFTSPVTFPLSHSHFFSLSFRHNSKYPVGPGCRLLVLVYLALGSIRLQAEASHSSQSHKMWLVLTTALQGDGLIGPIVSDRLGWTCYRRTTATECCGFFFLFFRSVYFFNPHFFNPNSPFHSISSMLMFKYFFTDDFWTDEALG